MKLPDVTKRPSAETSEEKRRYRHETIIIVVLFIIVISMFWVGMLSTH